MKSVLIEKVSNGYIARPFQPSCDWTRERAEEVRVYRTSEELSKDLPEFLDHTFNESIPDSKTL